MTQDSPHIVIVGGGAAGFFGAINCAERFPKARVTILEATRRVLTKVRISGGGRCNVTHHCFDINTLIKNYPRGSKELRGAFSRFQPADTVKWFESRGVMLKTEGDGRMFPTTDRSETIIDCLTEAAARAGVDVRLGALVTQVSRSEQGFSISLKDGTSLQAQALLLATGSATFGYDLSRALGHTLEPLAPSLFTFKIKDPRLDDLAGISFAKARLRLSFAAHTQRLEAVGPLLVTHWGLSGPAVLKLSAFGAGLLKDSNYEARLSLNLFPDLTPAEIERLLTDYKDQHPKRSIVKHPPLDVPRRFWQKICAFLQIADDHVYSSLSKKSLAALVQEFTAGSYEVAGKGEFKDEFVTMGGVRLREVDFRTMESRLCPRLFFAGELLDVDGITGGFNFQNAWTTSYIAAQNMGIVAAQLASKDQNS